MNKKIIYFVAISILFVTLSVSKSSQSFRFVVMSDSHNTLGTVKPEQVATAIKKMKPDMVLHAGDFTCCLSGNPNNRFRFDELKFLGDLPVFPTTGNHDYDGAAENDFEAFWKGHRPATSVEGAWPFTYSFDHKGYHFVAIGWNAPDFAWARNDLKKNAGKPTVIFTHWAALNTGCKPAYRTELNSIATANPDVKAVFSGHSHCYGKVAIKNGTYQVFTGTVSHDCARDTKYKRKHVFIVVDATEQSLRICPASVEDGILEGGCVAPQ